MTPPKRPPVKRKPIGAHPHAGQLAIVVSFRLQTNTEDREAVGRHFRQLFGPTLIRPTWTMADLDVAVRVIGAEGEASIHQGAVGLTEDDITTIRTARDQDILDTKGRL